jgi:hypothetical protein
MPIVNIVDNREREHRFLNVNAVVEAACHDNVCKDADQAPRAYEPVYEERANISLQEAVTWASAYSTPVTLFLYDEGGGICLEPHSWRRPHAAQWIFAEGEA